MQSNYSDKPKQVEFFKIINAENEVSIADFNPQSDYNYCLDSKNMMKNG